MNKRIGGKALFPALLLAVFFAAGMGTALILTACAGAPAAVRTTSAAAASTPALVYWTGNGAEDISIAVLVPEGRALTANEAYLPAMIQGVLAGDFAKFSAMKVLDRQNLESVIAGGEGGYYVDEGNFVQLGTVANVRYVLNGALRKTGLGFSLQLKITEAVSGESKAAYTGDVSAAELENLSGVKKASAELLTQLGVSLTEAGKASLLGAASSSAIRAETALARGIAAQRSGMVIEALSYYYEAANFDPGLAEAASRSSVLSADIRGGNIGQGARNDIQRRAAWVKILDEAAAFFKDHPPFELIYDPALTTGSINYDKETANLSFEAKLISAAGMKIIYDLDQGLKNTGRSEEWNIGVNSIYSAIPESYEISAALINEDGEMIGESAQNGGRPWINYNFSDSDIVLCFFDVDANKITDKLTVSIISVNGMDVKTAGERGYMSIFTENFAPLKDPFKLEWLFGDMKITDYTGPGGNLVIPSKIGRWSVASIGNSAFYDNRLALVTIPNSVTSIGDNAFSKNQLASVAIPDSVASIGDNAFSKNRLASVAIPNSVTSIGGGVFSENQLVSVAIPNSVTSIGDGAFSKNRLVSVVIGNSVVSIGHSAFFDNEIASVTIGNSVATIGVNAFYGNRLTSVTIPDSVTAIEYGAFWNNQIASVALPANSQGDVSNIFYSLGQTYASNDKKAGTYVRTSDNWRMR
jgi:TolB-like protein